MYNNDYDYYNYGSNNYKKNKFSLNNLNLKGKLILGAVLLIGLTIVLIGINSVKNYFNSYGYLEKKMISAAKDYVNKNNLIVWDESYLDVTKIGTDIKKNCTIMSGVFVDSSYNYKAYLDCDDYKSKVVSNKSDNVSLNGDDVVILGKDATYIEYGVTGNNQVSIQGKVGSDEGVYTLKYIVVANNSIIDTLERKVVIIDKAYINNLYPSLILKGDKIEYVQKGHKYQDQGVFASDVIDLDLGNKVKVTGSINTNNVGEYEITYTVTNSRGYSNSITRKVVVVNNFSTTIITGYLSPETVTSGSVTINLKIVGDNYDYMILPNGSRTTSKIIEYPVTENKTYNFISYDKDGKSITKIITIDNIDNTKPNASCVANVYNDYTQIYVTPYSGKEIKSYNYMINGVSSGELVSTNYKSNVTDVNSASVIIKDSIGNSNTISCEVKYIDPSVGNTNIKYYTYSNEEYVIANTKNDLDTFVSLTTNRISQTADIPNCGEACMSFSEYHMYELQYGNMYSMNLNNACNWYHSTKIEKKYTGVGEEAKRDALNTIYNEIFNGRVVMLQIANASEMNSRHFGVVVGYRRSVNNANALRAEDLIFIDAWDGKLKSLDPNHGAHWAMFSEDAKGGYQVGIIKPAYYQ